MMNQHSHLFRILHSERVPKSPISTKTAQILLLVRTSEAKAGNISLCWCIDRLLRCFGQLSDGETLGLIISGKLSGVDIKLCHWFQKFLFSLI